MSEQDSHALQIFVGQVGQYVEVDRIVCEDSGVLSKSELFEPGRNIAHDGTEAFWKKLTTAHYREEYTADFVTCIRVCAAKFSGWLAL